MTITPTYATSNQGCSFLQMYDIGGATSFTHDSVVNNNGTQNVNADLNVGSITPSQVGEFIINTTGLSWHSMLNIVTDANGHTPTADFTANTLNDDGTASQLNDDDGRSHIISTDTLPISFIYHYVSINNALPDGVLGWNSITSSFRAGSSSQPAPPTGLKITNVK